MKNSILGVTKNNNKSSKWLKIARISGIIIILLTILNYYLEIIINLGLSKTSYIQILFPLILIPFYYGFSVLGKIYNKKLLKVTSILLIIFAGLFALLLNLLDILNIRNVTLNLVSIVCLIIIVILNILLGVGIIRLRDNIKYAKTAGILFFVSYSVYWLTFIIHLIFIISIAFTYYTFFTIIRGLSELVLYLSLVILLFKASKQN